MAAVQSEPITPATDPRPAARAAWRARLAGEVRGALASTAVVLVLGLLARVGAAPSLSAFLAGAAQAVVLGVLLRRPGSRTTAALAGGGAFAALLAAGLFAGAAPLAAVAPAAATVAAPLVLALVLARFDLRTAGLGDARGVAVAMLAAVAMPVADLVGTPVDALPALWLAGAFGAVTTLPLVLGWSGEAGRALAARTGEALPTIGGAAAAAVALGVFRPAAAVLAVLALALPAVRLGPLAVAATCAIAGTAAAGLAVGLHADAGGFGAMALGLGVAFAMATVMSVLRQQRDAAGRAAQTAASRVAALTGTVPALIAEFGRNLRHRAANREYLQWHGVSGDALIGRSILEIFGEHAAGAMGSTVQRVLAGQPQRLEVQAGDRILDIRYVPVFDVHGSVDGFEMLAQDVTWRSQGERRLRAWLEVMDQGCAVLDEHGVVGLASERLGGLLGVAPGALSGRPLETWLAPSTQAQFRQVLQTACDRPGTHTIGLASPADGVRSDGVRLPVEISLTRLAGEETVQVLVAVRDLSAVQHAERSIAEARAQARQALDAIGDAVVVCDADLVITAFNPAAARMTGRAEADALGRPLDEVVRFVDPGSGQVVRTSLHEAIAGNTTVRSRDDRAVVADDGRQHAIEDSGSPMRDRQGRVSGGVLLFHDVGRARELAATLSHQAQHDYLTGLPNRVLLQDRLSQAVARIPRGGNGALLYLDLDFFKHINDSLGHPAGDHVLQEVARRLVDGVREDDTVSRQGGDEFVLLLNRLADPRDAARVAEKLIRSIEAPVSYQGQDLHVSASIGIALFPQDGRDVPTIMKQADTALYYAKEAGRCRFSYFTDVMSERAEQRMRTEHDLRIALGNGDFSLHYQPRIALPGASIVGMEALVRWRRPDGAIALPDDFITVAEDTGLILQLDEWVMREACRQNRYWQDLGLPAVPVSVNVSLARFDGERLLAQVRSVLDETGLDARWLEIEFTESQMFTHQDKAREAIAELKAMGVRVAIDDFGRGHSSLSYLVQYRFDTLKIDRSFIHGLPDPKHAAIVQAIVAMGRALDYDVVAEGVETEEQAALLGGHGCSQMQGFLYSRPLPAEQFAGLLGQGTTVEASREVRIV